MPSKKTAAVVVVNMPTEVDGVVEEEEKEQAMRYVKKSACVGGGQRPQLPSYSPISCLTPLHATCASCIALLLA
jgi:hypothetical protein